MSITDKLAILVAASCFALPLRAAPKEEPFAPVAKNVGKRAGVSVRWQQDAEAREECLETVRLLLKRPLTAGRAAQIAALNNRELLATLEDIGISHADLREAGMWKNPSFDLSVRFPDRAQRGPDWEEAAAFDLLDLLMLPLRKRVAADHLREAQLRVSDAVLKVLADTKGAVYQMQAAEQISGGVQAALEAERAALELAQKQHEAGNITDLDLLRQQARYDEVRLDSASAEA
jgi:cobalt-zinc-cadmium efflux system outer membrane protein